MTGEDTKSNATSIQLDMTTFFSADSVLPLLRSGHWATAEQHHEKELNSLALILGSALFFDEICVAVPAVVDPGTSASDFGPEPSQLAVALKDAGIVGITTLDEASKAQAQKSLRDEQIEVEGITADYFARMPEEDAELLLQWARVQRKRNQWMRTRVVEEVSQIHREWNEPMVEAIIGQLAEQAGRHHVPIYANASADELKYVIRNNLRGFIYQTGAFHQGLLYLPDGVREGLLIHMGQSEIRAARMLALLPVATAEELQAETKEAFSKSQGQPARLPLPLMSAPIFARHREGPAWQEQSIAARIVAERLTGRNQQTRELIREIWRARLWDNLIREVLHLQDDLKIWWGHEPPGLLRPLTTAVRAFKPISPELLESLLRPLLGVGNDHPAWRKLRGPLYLSGHMRYLWDIMTKGLSSAPDD